MTAFAHWLKGLFGNRSHGTVNRTRFRRRSAPGVEHLEDRLTPAVQLLYGGPGTVLRLTELSAGNDSVSVSELAPNRLRISLGNGTFASGSNVGVAGLIYETGTPTTSHFIEVDHSTANNISTLAIDTGNGTDTLELGFANAAGGVGNVTVRASSGNLATALRSFSLPGGNLTVIGGPLYVSPGTIVATHGGDLTLSGKGGGIISGIAPIGIDINNATLDAGATGNVSVTGVGATSAGSSAYGVYVHAGAVVKGYSAIVNGTAGTGGDFDIGVEVVDAGSQIMSYGGSVQATGKGGGSSTSAFNYGVEIQAGGVVMAGGDGVVTVTGTGGVGRGDGNFGIIIGGLITSMAGAVQVTGTGGGTGAATQNFGVYLFGGTVNAGGTGSVTITGTGGDTVGNEALGGSRNHGVFLLNGQIMPGGDVQINGQGGGSGTNNDGIQVYGGLVTPGANGTLTLNGTGTLTPNSAGLRIRAGGHVTAAGADPSYHLGLAPGAVLDVALTPEHAAALGYTFVRVEGTVDLGGATLQAVRRGNLTPGLAFTLISNDGVDSVEGAFANGGPINYAASDGNDVVLTAQPGVTITPTSGLTTTEAGGTATFRVVLETHPTADVTVNFTSSNTAEGTVTPSITFTTANWNVPQTVTVRGVDDLVADGDRAYSIVTAVQSADLGYAAIKPSDVQLTNIDNDLPANPGAATSAPPAVGSLRAKVVRQGRPLVQVFHPNGLRAEFFPLPRSFRGRATVEVQNVNGVARIIVHFRQGRRLRTRIFDSNGGRIFS